MDLEEFEKLPPDEQEGRCKEFVEFVNSGVPCGLSDLAHYAEKFGTPIPKQCIPEVIW
jgi:hypothetical protein